jgi:hypothetical protein
MMLACEWITVVENRQAKAEAGFRWKSTKEYCTVREGPAASPAHI